MTPEEKEKWYTEIWLPQNNDISNRIKWLLKNQKIQQDNPTVAEIKLYEELKKLKTWVFPQHIAFWISILDFMIFSGLLYIEINGFKHEVDSHQIYIDNEKRKRIIKEGYTLLEFSNEEVLNSCENVVAKIKTHIEEKFRKYYKVGDMCRIYKHNKLVDAKILNIYSVSPQCEVEDIITHHRKELFMWQIFYPK
jgi:very-short-patch-repair endonuclease